MAITNYDFSIYKNRATQATLIAKNEDGTRVNLSGYSARGNVQFRNKNVLTLNPVIRTNYVSGLIDLTIEATGASGTSGLAEGVYPYKIDILPSSEASGATALVRGDFKVEPEF